MSATRTAVPGTTTALYLRLPARADVSATTDINSLALPFALAVRGRVREQGNARLDALSEAIRHSQRVVLLFSASDVTLMRIAVPPIPAHRLSQALPALVEDRIIGDPADCVLAAGPAGDGLRTVAVIDRTWLEHWVTPVRHLGARRLSAVPLQLCLPPSKGQLVAWLFDFPHVPQPSHELVIRTGDAEGAGLPLGTVDSEASSPEAVLATAIAMTAGSPLQLSVPEQALPDFTEALARRSALMPEAAFGPVELRKTSWDALIDAAAQSEIDLIAGVATRDQPAFDWLRWRLPMGLALALLLLNVLALHGDWWRLHQEGARLETDMLRTYRTAFPDDAANDKAVMADPVSRMKQRRIAQSRAAGEPSSGDFLWLCAALGDAWPAIQQATGMEARAVTRIDYRDAGLLLRLKPGVKSSHDTVRKILIERQLELSAGSDPNSWQVQSAR